MRFSNLLSLMASYLHLWQLRPWPSVVSDFESYIWTFSIVRIESIPFTWLLLPFVKVELMIFIEPSSICRLI